MPDQFDETRSRVMLKYVVPFALVQFVLWVGVLAAARSAPGYWLGWITAGACLVTIVAVAVLIALLHRELFGWVASVGEQVRRIGPQDLGRRVSTSSPREIRDMVDAVNGMLDRLESGYAEQARFIGNVSHELRTPLTYLLAEAQRTRRGALDYQAYEQFVDDVETEARRMRDTVQSFLTLARASGGLDHLTPTHVQASELVLDAIERCQPLATHRAVQISPTFHFYAEEAADIAVRGDSDLLTAMVENLLRNAIQHSPPDTTVEISLTGAKDEVVVLVRDHGEGIPTETLDTIFERYRNSGCKPANQESVGLGLAIAKAVALTHGGTISARNHTGGGAVFEVSLPVADRSHLTD